MVVCGGDEALHCAVRFYFRQRSFGKVYLFPVSICRKGFILVTSERERMNLGLSATSADVVFGNEADAAEMWALSKKYSRQETACKEAMRNCKRISAYQKEGAKC
jgi:hypothetical protein